GGTTIAVLGCGVDICYPRNNAGLMREIMGRGLAVSEFEDGTEPKPYNFPVRNRVISGLSLATAVAEAGLNSGSLITAERAAEQGRLVYAVPGNINRASSIGCNRLIQDGAIALAVFDDIALDLGFKRLKAQERRENELGEDEKAVYEALRRCGEMSADELCADTGMPAWKMNGLITVLEMKGMVGTAMGRVFVSGV
ncbi:MAG: DNA-protecting protein DprA, partial [Clostridiales Family XIII bacterium]|nr:DNA-protecting protein DprA [Clostridiales Family XIII bacterium]